MNSSEKIQILESIDLFSFFHESTLERLAQESRELVLKEGATVFNEGDLGKTLYIVLQGEILIHQSGKNLTTMVAGTFFGEMSLIESVPRTAGAKALIPTILLEISDAQFEKYFASQPKALLAIMKTISARSRKISSNLLSINTPKTETSANSQEGSLRHLDENYQEALVFSYPSFKFTHVNTLASLEIGYGAEEIKDISFLDLAVDMTADFLNQICEPLVRGLRSFMVFETEFRRKDQSTFPVEVKLEQLNKTDSEFLALIHDITERKQMEETIRQMAYYDSLTGLPNRNLMNDRLAVVLAHATRDQEQVAIMFLDLDNFKIINDSLGHEAGDRLLQQASKRIKDSLRQADTVARMGGDEFIILAPGIRDSDDAAKLAQKLIDLLAQPFKIDDNELYIGCSIGISVFPNDGTEIKNLLKNSDLAMYRAKETGKNTFKLFTPSMNSHAMERLFLEKNLRKALENKEFELHYQPKINLKTGQISGVEALLRWTNQELGQVSPSQFMPVAEETRLIIPIGQWVLGTACKQAHTWKEQGLPPCSMSVNLSVTQFTHPLLISDIKKVLDHTGIDPRDLGLEITESILMKDTALAVSTLNKLSDVGIKISIDDFGTGFFSLNYLKNLPIDFLKIDQAFVKNLEEPTNAAITKTIVALAQSLKMKTIAEGVETEAQRNFLRELQCDEAQGYLFSNPLPANQITQLLEKETIF